MKTILFGTLYSVSPFLQKAIISVDERSSFFETINAFIYSPLFLSSTPTTPASITSGWVAK